MAKTAHKDDTAAALGAFNLDRHGEIADALEAEAKAAGANDVLAGRIRREAAQFLARITSAVTTGTVDPAMNSAPPVEKIVPMRPTAVEVASAGKADVFADGERFTLEDGTVIGARVNKSGLIALRALAGCGNNVRGDVFGALPRDAFAWVSTGAAVLVDPGAMKVIARGR